MAQYLPSTFKEAGMQVQDISLTQIVVVLLFLGTLILLQQLLKNNKFNFQGRLNKKKRVGRNPKTKIKLQPIHSLL